MKAVLKDYLAIFRQYPKDALNKKARKARHALLQAYEKQVYAETADIDELQSFAEQYREQIRICPQFIAKFARVLTDDINNGGVAALKLLAGEDEENNHWQEIYHLEAFRHTHTLDLIEKLLDKEPDYLPALRQKHKQWRQYFDYSIHEVPWGVLNGNIVADAEDMAVMQQQLAQFAELDDRLGGSNQAFIRRCRLYYTAWADYLAHQAQYGSFEHYLDSREIEY